MNARDAAAQRTAEARSAAARPYDAERDIEPPQALRFTLKYVLGLCMLGIAEMPFYAPREPP